MASKIKEKLIEPAKVEVGSIFKIKILKYETYQDILNLTYEDLKKRFYVELKGGII